MANLPIELLRFNGQIGPQYLDVNDKSGGPEGTMKPLTKEVLRDLVIQNFPELQKVQDADVKAELEAIKQKQQQILERLDDPINTQVTGSNVEDGQAVPVRTIGIKSTYVDLLDNPVTVLPGMSHTTSIIDLTDCSDMTLAIRVQGSKKWRTIWQNRTENGAGLAATHLIDRRESAAPYDAKRESLKTPYGYAVVTNGESEEIVVESIAIVKWVVGGENNGA